MGTAFWLKRFLLATTVAFFVLFGTRLAKGHPQMAALQFAGGWALATGVAFTLAGYARYRRNPSCWLPKDRRA